jgi:hypothetical protein
MIDMRWKPRHLPQVSAPFEIVVDRLNNSGIDSEQIDVNPEELNPMQGITYSDHVSDFDPNEMSPIWISKDNDVIDGHHRYVSALNANQPIKCIKISLNGKDGARELNKIQDIYEYEEQRNLEEVVLQNVINQENDQDAGIDENDFLKMLEEATIENLPETGNQQTVFAYRDKPISENSVVGNFFMLEPVDGYNKYEIDFENLLDTNDLGIDFKSGQKPPHILAKNWFPNIDFESLSQPFGIPVDNLKNKAVAEKAKSLGYDGIKYGNTIIQGLK